MSGNEEHMKKLWETFGSAEKEVEAIQEELEKAKDAHSNAIKALLDANGGEKLIQKDGELHTIMFRSPRYYLRLGKAGRPKKNTTLRTDT